MGFCGNALAGLDSKDMTLIIPRFDDCISLLLGSCKTKATSLGTYFMTDGWLKGERNIWREYEYTMQKYGEETGKMIFDMMLGHYNTLALLDSGCFDLAETEAEMKYIAEVLKLEYVVLPGTLEFLHRLLTGPWDNEVFLTIPPGSIISDTVLITKE